MASCSKIYTVKTAGCRTNLLFFRDQLKDSLVFLKEQGGKTTRRELVIHKLCPECKLGRMHWNSTFGELLCVRCGFHRLPEVVA